MALRERYIGQYAQAQSAAIYIDANGIIASANNIKSELDEFLSLAGDVGTAGIDLNSENLCFDGENFAPKVDELVQGIKSRYDQMIGDLDAIIAKAESEYNKKQDELNEAARELDDARRRAAEAEASRRRNNGK